MYTGISLPPPFLGVLLSGLPLDEQLLTPHSSVLPHFRSQWWQWWRVGQAHKNSATKTTNACLEDHKRYGTTYAETFPLTSVSFHVLSQK